MMKLYEKKKTEAEAEAVFELCALIEARIDSYKERQDELMEWFKDEKNSLWQHDEEYNKPWQWDMYRNEEEELPIKIAILEKFEKELLK